MPFLEAELFGTSDWRTPVPPSEDALRGQSVVAAVAALMAVGAWVFYALVSASLTLAEDLARGLLGGVVGGVAARSGQRWRRRLLVDWNSR